MRGLVLGLAVGAGMGGLGTYLMLNRPHDDRRHAPDSGAVSSHPATKYGYPSSTTLRYFNGFVVAWDNSRRNPAWVLEHVTRKSSSGPGDRKYSDFFEEESLPDVFRSRLSDFKGSGYDRGHMAPAQNHKGSQKDMNDTHSLMNISPQVGKGFNRNYWSRFEAFVKQLTRQKGAEVYIVTGPLYIPKRSDYGKGWTMQHPMIGVPPRMVAVPTHFFKVVLLEKPAPAGKQGDQKTYACGAFVMPNSPIDPAIPLEAFAVPLSSLEAISGQRFFPGLITNDTRMLLNSAASRVHANGLAVLKAAGKSGSVPLLTAGVGSADISQNAVRTDNGAQSGGRFNHLCDSVQCKLPAEDFWMNNNKQRDMLPSSATSAMTNQSADSDSPTAQ